MGPCVKYQFHWMFYILIFKKYFEIVTEILYKCKIKRAQVKNGVPMFVHHVLHFHTEINSRISFGKYPLFGIQELGDFGNF